MSARCPAGHESAATDYCDTCGTPMDAVLPAASGPTGGGAAGKAGGTGAAWTDGGDADVAAGTQTCPNCEAVSLAGYLFCEVCGYDFTTGAMPRSLAEGLAAVDTRVTSAVPLSTAPAPSPQAAEASPADADGSANLSAPATTADPAAPAAAIAPAASTAALASSSTTATADPSAPAATVTPTAPVVTPTSSTTSAPATTVDPPASAAALASSSTTATADPSAPAATVTPTAPVATAAPSATPGPLNSAVSGASSASVAPVTPPAPPATAAPAVAPVPEAIAVPTPATSAPEAAPSPGRPANTAPSRRATGDWVVEVWIDPDWYAVQESAEACPSPGVPDIERIAGISALVGRYSASRRITPDIDCRADSGVSRRHAQFTTDGTRWWVEDLGSANGTYVGPASGPLPSDPIPAGQRVEIDDDDRIYVGAWTRLVLRRATASEVADQG